MKMNIEGQIVFCENEDELLYKLEIAVVTAGDLFMRFKISSWRLNLKLMRKIQSEFGKLNFCF